MWGDFMALNHDGRNDIAEAGKRENIWREGRYGNDHDEMMSKYLGQRCPQNKDNRRREKMKIGSTKYRAIIIAMSLT